MSSSLIRGKYIIGRVIDNDRAEVIEDGAIFQRDGKIVEIGADEDLSGRHQPDEVLGDGSHVVVPGFVNGSPSCRCDARSARLSRPAARALDSLAPGGTQRRPVSGHALLGVRVDRVGRHDGPAHQLAVVRTGRAMRTSRGGGFARLSRHRHEGFVLVHDARPEPLSGPRTSVEEQRRQIARDVYGHVEAFYRDYLG